MIRRGSLRQFTFESGQRDVREDVARADGENHNGDAAPNNKCQADSEYAIEVEEVKLDYVQH